MIGAIYIKGEGVSIDLLEGLKWMKLAKENGSQEAVTFLQSHHE